MRAGRRGEAMKHESLTRRERERLQQRHEILAAAQALFAQKGFHNVSMLQIAERAEFAVGTLYKFFRSKGALYRTLMLEQADRFHRRLADAVAQGEDEQDKLRRFVRAKGEHFRENAAQIRLYLAETRGASVKALADLDAEMRRRHERFVDHLAAVFARGVENGRFAPIASPRHLAIAIDSFTSALLFLWLEAPDKHPYPEDPDTVLDTLFKGLIPPASSDRSG